MREFGRRALGVGEIFAGSVLLTAGIASSVALPISIGEIGLGSFLFVDGWKATATGTGIIRRRRPR